VLTKLWLLCSRPNSTPTRGGGKANRHACAQDASFWTQQKRLPKLRKSIKRTQQHILGRQPHMAVTRLHSPKRDKRKNKRVQARIHRKREGVTGRRIRPRQAGSLVPGVWWDRDSTLCKPCSQDSSPTTQLGPQTQPL
jgi:hypothetical protein